jgi:hypothetical protein
MEVGRGSSWPAVEHEGDRSILYRMLGDVTGVEYRCGSLAIPAEQAKRSSRGFIREIPTVDLE